MKTQIKLAALFAAQTILPSIVFAGPPVKYPTCALSTKINSVPNGAGVYFDESCSVAYVLPPMKGTVELSGLTPNTNLRQCGAYETTLRILDLQTAQLEKIQKQMMGSDAVANNNPFGGGSFYGPATTPAPIEVKVMDPRLMEQYSKTLELIALTRSSLAPFENESKGVAVGKINYFTNWGDLVEAYKKANPKIHFERLPLEAGRIVFSRKIGATGEVIDGSVAHTVQGIENTTEILANGTLQSTSGSVIMSDAISGQVVLNFAGACPFVKDGKMPSNVSASDIEFYLSSNFQYRYSLQSLRSYRATYNLASIAKHIQESRSSGGLFSSSTVNSVVNSNSSSDEFNMIIDSNQQSFEYDSTLRAEVKTELIARVIREMADITGQAAVLPSLTPPPAHGAVAVSEGLQKCPNIYCQVGAIAIRVIDSIFGNSSAVASYTREKNGVATDDVKEKRMFSYVGSMTFSGVK